MDRESPFLFLRYAGEFLSTADVVRDHESAGVPTRGSPLERLSNPGYFLYGHAIELALKAYLRHRGRAVKEIRKHPFGHDLVALLAECRSEQIDNVIGADVDQRKKDDEIVDVESRWPRAGGSGRPAFDSFSKGAARAVAPVLLGAGVDGLRPT